MIPVLCTRIIAAFPARSLVLLLGAWLAPGSGMLVAQQDLPGRPPIATPEPASAPPTPRALAEATALQALEAAHAELAELLEEQSQRARERGARIAEQQQRIFELARQEQDLRAELRRQAEREATLGQQIDEQDARVRRLEGQDEALRAEVMSQAQGLRDRLEGSMTALEHPELLEAVRGLLTRDDFSPETAMREILTIGQRLVEEASHASIFETPIQIGARSGRVEPVALLRLGLLGGYYLHEPSGEAGLLLPRGAGDDLLQGSTEGLSPAQRQAIAGAIRTPEAAALLPVDPTGGLGIVTLQARDNAREWFDKGGEFMYALLAVALLAVLLVIERSIVLTVKSLGIRRVVARTLALVEAGKIDEALEYTDRAGGATGKVLHAALIHHGQGQSVLEEAVQEALLQHTTPFHARLGFISLCAAVSPLLGLLGTVTGMIETFRAVTALGTSDPRNMAGGIAVALITTQAGLYVAIPCLLFRGVLGALADSGVGKIEAGAMSVVLALLGQNERAGAQTLELYDKDESQPTAAVPGPAATASVALSPTRSTLARSTTDPQPGDFAPGTAARRASPTERRPPTAPTTPDDDLVALEQEP